MRLARILAMLCKAGPLTDLLAVTGLVNEPCSRGSAIFGSRVTLRLHISFRAKQALLSTYCPVTSAANMCILLLLHELVTN